MEWDRRAFVKFAVGAVVGLHASPLVPKLMDDVAIWTQNWSWVPDPETGAVAWANTVNPATASGVKVRLVKGRLSGERLIRVEGNPDYPLGMGIGGVIPQDASALQMTYNDTIRVKAPMLLDRASGIYHTLDWDKALEMLATKLAELHRTGQAHTVAALGAEPETINGVILDRFMAAYGSPNLAFHPLAADTLALAGRLMLGNQELGFDLANARFVVSFGTPILENFGSPVATRAAFRAWRKNGGKLVQVEPRASVSASQANAWLACAPGTEGAVALAMCQVLLKSGLADRSAEMAGLAEFKALLDANFTPKKVEALSGVPADQIGQVAGQLAMAKKGVAVCGPGQGSEPGRLADFLAVLALNALAGKVGRPGGLVLRQAAPLAPISAMGKGSSNAKRAPLPGVAGLPLGGYNAAALAQAALAGKPYKLNLLLAVGNPAYSGPQAAIMRRVFRAVPFTVAITPFLDESASLADLVLPAATFLECWGDCPTPYGLARAAYGLHRPLATGQPQAKAAGDVLLALAARLGGQVAAALPHQSVQEALKVRAARLGDFDKLAQKSWWVADEPSYGRAGRVELGNPVVLKALAGLGEADFTAEGYHLVLAAVPSLRSANLNEPITPYMLKIQDDNTLRHTDQTVVELNPETGEHYHLHDGDEVWVDTRHGSSRARVHLFAGARPGMVYMPVGLGHTAFGMYLKGKGDNYNHMVDVAADPVSGLPVYGLTPARIRMV